MLFTKDITQITYEDVFIFCNQRLPESVHLDYKRDFPRNLEKTIAAFANTMGGLVIIGVEDDDGKPKLPVEGLKYKEGYREKVNNIILSNIYPPIFPEIQVCDPVNKRTFVIIRIPQSNITPHYIRHRTHPYIRTDNINYPERLATADEIEWLRNRRKKSEELKEILYNSALDRYKNYIKLYKRKIPFCEGTVSIIPLYPSKLFKTNQEIEKIIESIRARGYQIKNIFPNVSNKRSIQGGVAFLPYNSRTYYTEINQFGLIYYKEFLGDFYKIKYKIAYISWIIELIDLFLECAIKFYERLGYWGLLEFKFSLNKLFEVVPLYIERSLRLLEEDEIKNKMSIDDSLKWHKEYYVNDIKNKRIEILIKLIIDISWSLGLHYITEDNIKDFLRNKNRISI